MRTSSQVTGDAAERLVAEHLAAMGWRVLGCQVRVGRDELDIVAVDPAAPAELVIVEVRARARRDFGLPEETLDHAKRRNLRRALATLRSLDCLPDATPIPRLPARVDLVAVEPTRDPTRLPAVRHHRAIAL